MYPSALHSIPHSKTNDHQVKLAHPYKRS
uniref:Uncharacterized protein n=1 Tax=Arundo donax TaxID=35708 RepID=A0A0A8Y5D8_ARUDO